MADTDIVQVIAEARVDARSLSEFVFKPASFMVNRRLAPSIHTLNYYLALFENSEAALDAKVSSFDAVLITKANDAQVALNKNIAIAQAAANASASAVTASAELIITNALDGIIKNSGFVTVDSFELGATITERNQALRHTADGNLYKWGGDMPKVVPSGSTPESTGGIQEGAWLIVTDTALRQEFHQYKAETKDKYKSLAGNNRATSIERERKVMRSAFMLPNYDHMHGAGADFAQVSEAMGMHYWFDPQMPREDQHGIVNRYMEWGEAAVAQRGIPVPYFGTLSTFTVSNSVNAHHFFWGAKMLLEHYVSYGDVKHLNKAIEICDWIIANLTYGTSPNRRIARTQVDKISIKTISSADTLLRISKITGEQKYKELYYENLSWVRENMMHTDGIFSVDVDAEIPVKTDGVSHEQLEMIDGMIDAYIWSGDKTLLDYAHAHYNAVIKKWFMNIPDVVNSGMPNIQIGYVGRKFLNNDYKGIGETVALRAITNPDNRNADGSIAGNIYAMCYALAFLSTPDESHNARSHIRFGENDKSVIVGLNASSKSTATGIMVGNEAGRESLGADLLSVGNNAGRFNEGSKVIAIGNGAAESNKANGSVYIGTESGFRGEGGNGVFTGYRAGYTNKGINVAGFGYEAGMNNTGNNCTFIGWQAGKNNAENDVFIIKGQTATPIIKANFSSNIISLFIPNSPTVDGNTLPPSSINMSLDRTTNELVFTVNLGSAGVKTARLQLA